MNQDLEYMKNNIKRLYQTVMFDGIEKINNTKNLIKFLDGNIDLKNNNIIRNDLNEYYISELNNYILNFYQFEILQKERINILEKEIQYFKIRNNEILDLEKEKKLIQQIIDNKIYNK